MPLAQAFIFICSLDFLMGFFFPILNILFSAFCSWSIIGGVDDEDSSVY